MIETLYGRWLSSAKRLKLLHASGMSRAQPEQLVDRGAFAALPTGFTRMIPTSEVERLRQASSRD